MKVLHVGCGGSTLPDIFPELEEIRLDLDPASGANMIGSMLDISMVTGARADAGNCAGRAASG